MDAKSTRSVKSNNRHKAKICGLCGKKETNKFKLHCDRQHNGQQVLRDSQSELQGEPYCENWRDVALNDAKAINISWLYKKGGDALTRSKVDARSIATRSEIDQAEQEQKKEEYKIENVSLQSQQVTIGPSPSAALTLSNINQLQRESPQLSTDLALKKAADANSVLGSKRVHPVPTNHLEHQIKSDVSEDRHFDQNKSGQIQQKQNQKNASVNCQQVDTKMMMMDVNDGIQINTDSCSPGVIESAEMLFAAEGDDYNGQTTDDNHFDEISQQSSNDITGNKRQKISQQNQSSSLFASSESGFSLPVNTTGFNGSASVIDSSHAFGIQSSSSAFAFAVPVNKPKTIFDPLVKLARLANNNQDHQGLQNDLLMELCPSLGIPEIFQTIYQQISRFTGLTPLFLNVYKKNWNLYTTKQINGLISSAFIFKEQLWFQLPMKINTLGEQMKAEATLFLKGLLLKGTFSEEVAAWFCENIELIDDQSLKLIDFLNTIGNDDDEQVIINCLLFSSVVAIGSYDAPGFIRGVKALNTVQLFVQLLQKKIYLDCSSSKQRISYKQFWQLIDKLYLPQVSKYISEKVFVQEILECPLGEWESKLESLHQRDQIQDVSNFKMGLHDLSTMNIGALLGNTGKMPGNYADDLRLSSFQYTAVFSNCRVEPNNLQFAIAQFAVAHSKNNRRQFWTVPAGQGKSRILAVIALIALLQREVTKVHFVFNNKHLMARDISDFGKYWEYIQMKNKVEYHCSLESIKIEDHQNELILVDEADELIFSRTQSFIDLVSQVRCICLTATPTNADRRDPEQKIISLFEFQQLQAYNIKNLQDQYCKYLVQSLNSIPNFETQQGEEIMLTEEQLASAKASEQSLISYIMQELQQRPVLLYCKQDLMEQLSALQIPFYYMDANAEMIDEDRLRQLDSVSIKQEMAVESSEQKYEYQLVVSTEEFAMRGFDYRAQQIGITLVLAKLFSNQREAIQGLNRVGRFGDPCKRVSFVGRNVVDEDLKFQYSSTLNKFVDEREQQLIQEKLHKEQQALELKKQKEEEKKRKREEAKQQQKKAPSKVVVASAAKPVDITQFTHPKIQQQQLSYVGNRIGKVILQQQQNNQTGAHSSSSLSEDKRGKQ